MNNALAVFEQEPNKPHERRALKTCARRSLFSQVPLTTTIGRLGYAGPRALKPGPCGRIKTGAFKMQKKVRSERSERDIEKRFMVILFINFQIFRFSDS